MKHIPSPLPDAQGVYVLSHPKTQSIYVGSTSSLRDRAYNWQANFKKFKIPGNFPALDADEYEFRVIKQTDGLTPIELRKLELTAIKRADAAGVKVLNPPPKVQPHENWEIYKDRAIAHMPVQIMYEGRAISYTEAAQLLGLAVSTVKTKMRKHKHSGMISAIRLEHI